MSTNLQKKSMSIGKSRQNSKKILKLIKKKPLVCTSIIADNKRTFLLKVSSASKGGSDLAELRIDSLKNRDPKNIQEIIRKSSLPLIVTNRNQENRGMFPSGNEESRLYLLRSSMEAKPAFIDIELQTTEKDRDAIIAEAKKKGIGVICSYHDFKNTPKTEAIVQFYKQVAETGADVAKLVFTPHSRKDVANILKAVQLTKFEGIPSTIFGMGEMGQDTRILSPVLGSCLTYCALKVEMNTGLFQVSLKDTKSIFGLIESKKKNWSSIRKQHKDILALALTEYLSVETYPYYLGKIIDA